MKRNARIIVMAIIVWITFDSCKTYKASSVARAYKSENYKLVWDHEFNKDGAVDSTTGALKEVLYATRNISGISQRMRGAKKAF